MNHFSGKINLSEELKNLALGTPITPNVEEKAIMGTAILLPYEKPAIENVLLTVETTLDKTSVKSFLEQESSSALSIFMHRFLGEACDKGTSIILTHAQTEDEEFRMFIGVNKTFNIRWFTTLSEEDFKTYRIELRKFIGEKTPNQIEAFSIN